MEYAPATSATAQRFMKKSLEIRRAKTTSDVRSAEEYAEHRDKKYDNDWNFQRLYDILPNPIEPELVLEDRNGSETFESVKRRAKNWRLMNSTRRADMNLGTMEYGVDHENNGGGQDKDSSLWD